MKIVITGSIAYDYLMSFPGKFKEMCIRDRLLTFAMNGHNDALMLLWLCLLYTSRCV